MEINEITGKIVSAGMKAHTATFPIFAMGSKG
jgi:hypothetical protein